MDSGASDTMFVSRESFNEYKPITPRTGDSAKAVDGNFEIVGEGTVVQRYVVDGQEKDITYTRALHTPTLNANLISISLIGPGSSLPSRMGKVPYEKRMGPLS
jgi:hypothetical protein